MCETKQPPQACNFWECQYYATTSLWCEYAFMYFLYSFFRIWFMQKYIRNSLKSLPHLLFLTLTPIGCFGGNQNQLCWLPYSSRFLWIYKQIWHPCPRDHGSKVCILLVYLLCLGGKFSLWMLKYFVPNLGMVLTQVFHLWVAVMKNLLAKRFWKRWSLKDIR